MAVVRARPNWNRSSLAPLVQACSRATLVGGDMTDPPRDETCPTAARTVPPAPAEVRGAVGAVYHALRADVLRRNGRAGGTGHAASVEGRTSRVEHLTHDPHEGPRREGL